VTAFGQLIRKALLLAAVYITKLLHISGQLTT